MMIFAYVHRSNLCDSKMLVFLLVLLAFFKFSQRDSAAFAKQCVEFLDDEKHRQNFVHTK